MPVILAAAGQAATLVATPLAENGQVPKLELLDANGQVLAVGVGSWENSGPAIRDFVATQAGDFFARVSLMTGSTQYSLLLTRGASFDGEPNSEDDEAQDLSLTHQALGALGLTRGGGNGARVAVVSTVSSGDAAGFQAIVNQLNDQTYFDFQATLVTPEQVDTIAELNAFDVVVIGNNGHGGSLFNNFAAPLRSWVEAGGGVVMTGWGVFGSGQASTQSRADLNAIIPVNLAGGYNYFYSGTVITPNATIHPVTNGETGFTISGNYYTEYPATNP